MSENVLIRLINQTPAYKRIWRRLSNGGKRRVLYIAHGSDFMLGTILEDVLEDEKA